MATSRVRGIAGGARAVCGARVGRGVVRKMGVSSASVRRMGRKCGHFRYLELPLHANVAALATMPRGSGMVRARCRGSAGIKIRIRSKIRKFR